MPYYPETTVIRGLVRVRRERQLPPQAMPVPIHTVSGLPVEAVQVVLQGDILRDYRILDVGPQLKLRDAEKIAASILVEAGHRVQSGQELARRGKGRRGRVVRSPVDGEVVRVEDGQIVLQASERTVEIQAKIQGRIENADQHTVQIVGTGAVIECAWGNGNFCYEVFRFLPPEGFVSLSKQDVRISEYRNVVVISREPVNKGDLLVAQQQQVAGVVAPSMPANLREFAMQLTFPILLTEGFGQQQPTPLIYDLLRSNMGRQASFNGVIPDRWSGERPEIVIPLPSGSAMPPLPSYARPLTVGAQVRITRAPWQGMIAKVVELPDAPQVIANGLRLPCASIELPGGHTGLVPLANLELLGEPEGGQDIDEY